MRAPKYRPEIKQKRQLGGAGVALKPPVAPDKARIRDGNLRWSVVAVHDDLHVRAGDVRRGPRRIIASPETGFSPIPID